ncbi:universal stress protein [Halorubrum salsamenti]|jgi:nucleotide-binding universal stress UspA family protein|uniref:universal stress protein n=1 Tax=Halorubrum salsamenti TaxID=2583990 RepID=UPI0011AADD50|nr:universal stress protein [Halorubrum salsamenti]
MSSPRRLEVREGPDINLYNQILIPLYGTDVVDSVVQYSLSLAETYDAALHVLSIQDEDRTGLESDQITTQEEWDTAAVIEPVVDQAHSLGLNVIPAVDSGHSPGVIRQYAEENDIDLLVHQKPKQTRLARVLRRDVSSHIIQNVPLPVLTIPDRDPSDPVGGSSTSQFTDILVPTDGYDEASVAFKHGLQIAKRHNATLHGLFVVDEQSYSSRPGYTWGEVTDSWEQRGTRLLEDITEKAATLDVPVRTTLSYGQAQQEILEYTEVNGIDLVTMGTRGLTGIRRLLQGSVASRVIEEADCPVLTINRTTAELKKHPYTFLRKENQNRMSIN